MQKRKGGAGEDEIEAAARERNSSFAENEVCAAEYGHSLAA